MEYSNGMTTSKVTSATELQQFQKLAHLMKKTPGQNKNPKYESLLDDLSTNTSKEAQDVRDIMGRMVGAELQDVKKLEQGS